MKFVIDGSNNSFYPYPIHVLSYVRYFWKDAEKMLNAVGTRYGRTRSLSNTDLVRFEVEGDKIHRHNDGMRQFSGLHQFILLYYITYICI